MNSNSIAEWYFYHLNSLGPTYAELHSNFFIKEYMLDKNPNRKVITTVNVTDGLDILGK